MMSRTNITSTRGVTFISDIAALFPEFVLKPIFYLLCITAIYFLFQYIRSIILISSDEKLSISLEIIFILLKK